jgi:hypothetical protein
VKEEQTPEITRLSIVRERQGKQAKEEHVSRTILSEYASEKDHNKEQVP